MGTRYRASFRQPFSTRAIFAVKTFIRRVFSKSRPTQTQTTNISLAQAQGQQNERTPPAPPQNEEASQADRHVTIEILPDELLLEIFHHDRLLAVNQTFLGPWKWQRLAHVCRSWRFLVFASPRRLELRLYYTHQKPVTQNLGCWPPFPIAIWYPRMNRTLLPKDEDNLIAALHHPDRVCEINFAVTSPLLERSIVLLREPFPVLEHLRLRSRDSARRPLVLPNAFLGGSAPRLRDIHLDGIAFPTLPHLLLTTRNLGSLQLEEIPRTNFFSPEMLVDGLSALTQLKSFKLHFVSPTPHFDQSSSRSLATSLRHNVLPALTEFRFRGASEYLEDLVARLDTPFLQQFSVEFFDQPVFEIPQLSLFIGRIERLRSPRKTSIQLWVKDIAITQRFQRSPSRPEIRLQISCCELGRRVASLANICRQLFPFLLSVERLDIKAYLLFKARRQRDQIDPVQWLELFRSFESVKALEVSGTLVGNIASALEHAAGEMTLDVFPALCDLRLNRSRESLSTSIESFIATRQLSGRPVSAHFRGERAFNYWDEDDQESVDP